MTETLSSFSELAASQSLWCATFIGIMGLIWGSFFNVCIQRIPLDESVVSKRSHCPKCKAMIPWYLNIPVLSYAVLKGKCKSCKTPISIQYPLVELSTAIIYVWLYFQYGLSIKLLAYAIFLSYLLVISVIDLHHRIIPDELSLSGIVVGFVFSFFVGDVAWYESLLGVLLGGGSFYLIAFTYEKMAGREGLGGGDIKLLAMIGAWLGYQSILTTVVTSSVLGSLLGIAFMLFQRKDFKTEIPFGPFLAVGAVVHLVWGAELARLMWPQY